MAKEEKIIKYDIAPPKKTRKPFGYWKERYDPKYADIASRMVASDFTEKDLAYMLGVTASAIKSWKHSFPDFEAACKNGKHNQIKRLVAKSMLEAAGYDYKTKKTRTIKDSEGNITKTEETEFDNHQSASPNLLVFLLSNLSSQLGLGQENAWRSRQKIEMESKNIDFKITGEVVGDQIAKLAGKLLEGSPTKQIESTIINNEK